jgi:4-hydroxybenzoate polyprenyltransferase
MKPLYTEEDVQSALKDVTKGKSVRKAWLDWGVPRSTLQNRIYGHVSQKEAQAPNQRLSQVQEQRLTDWVLVQEALGQSPTHTQIKAFAGRILAVRKDAKPLGKRWMTGFLKRNPILKTKKQFKIDSARVNGATSDILKAWFQKLEVPAIKAVKAENRWNMDEAGIMEGQGENGLVVGSAQKRFIQKKQPGSKAWTSFIECISATGVALCPIVMFKGKSVQQQWFPTDLKDFKNWQFTATENGWTSNATALEWLQKVFIPQTAPRDLSEARLLILDGHGSHETTEFMWECYSNNIHLLFLPPHTSHVLQPLDLSIFAPLKQAYRKQLGFLSFLTDSTPIGKRNFLACYQKARISALTNINIKAGWKASGLWPVRMSKPLMNRLLLENSNQQDKQALKTSRGELALDWNLNGSIIDWVTPQKSEDIRKQAHQILALKDTDSSTCRVLFRKVAKGLDDKDFTIASHELRIQQLEARVEQLEPRKRRKVQTSPNSRFAGIKAIREAQTKAGDRQIESEDLELSEDTVSTMDCIEVEE